MDLEKLSKFQIVLLTLLVSFMTSLVTGIVTVTLVNQAPPAMTQTIHKVIEKVPILKEDNRPKEIIERTKIITQEDLIIGLAKEYSNAVVSVIATKDLPVVEQYFVDPFENDDFFQQFIPPELLPKFQVPRYRQKGTEEKQISSGTGFFVSADGLLVTNRHVVEDKEAEYSIIMNNGQKMSVKILARDPLQDVAVLKAEGVKGSDFIYIPLGNSDNLKVGQTVVAIGNALGELQNTVSVGVISGLMRTVMASGALAGPEILQEVIQTDAAINPGNSGGPLLDLEGKVIGVNTAMAYGAQSVGFALPVSIIKKDIADVKEFNKIKYPFLGVRYLIVNSKIKEEKNLSVDYGALLIKDEKGAPAVMAGSPAAAVGLKEGDIILEFNKIKIDQENNLAKLLSKHKVGEKVSLKILRDGKEINIEMELMERPENL
ncbi:MAG: trypsin-like peptidase domain-containing protein [Candidatus Niyogibacteria bacterium]|nr:trypsin-like peptidase domain-containing protein [Candidatus Niyogibacteria bacterium]